MQYAKLFYAVLAGGFITLSLAPFGVWPLALLAAALLFHVLANERALAAFCYTFAFSLALFASGASWVYVSIHEFGFVTPALASALTALFCLVLALVNALAWLPFTLRPAATSPADQPVYCALLFASCGLFSEWVRSWIFSGFPWLYLGYSQVEGPLAGWVPVGGVYLASYLLYLSGAALAVLAMLRPARLLEKRYRRLLLACSALFIAWLVAPLLATLQWTQSVGKPRAISIVQGNISQHEKWHATGLSLSLATYNDMSAREWPASELLVWPEAAIPREYHAAEQYFSRLDSLAKSYSSALLAGVPYRGPTAAGNEVIYNSVVALGVANGVYHKKQLVPFGEYIPFEGLLGPVMELFSLPLSSMGSGSGGQQPLRIHDWQTLPLICYEIVYPRLAAKAARQSDVLVTVSNDAWFGRSIGPLQHLQMAQMRALESGRFVVRGTGTGVSAIINHRGEILQRSEQFQAQVLRGEISLREGNTPWLAGAYWLLPLLNALFILAWLRYAFLAKQSAPINAKS